VTSVLLNRYSSPEPYMEFPRGFKVIIFDSVLRTETSIMANYGKRKEYARIMEAKGNVIVRNELKKQQLNTERLTWDENLRMIFTSEPVKITTLDKVIFGKGLRSNESFHGLYYPSCVRADDGQKRFHLILDEAFVLSGKFHSFADSKKNHS
jgi:hypothetical protein